MYFIIKVYQIWNTKSLNTFPKIVLTKILISVYNVTVILLYLYILDIQVACSNAANNHAAGKASLKKSAYIRYSKENVSKSLFTKNCKLSFKQFVNPDQPF